MRAGKLDGTGVGGSFLPGMFIRFPIMLSAALDGWMDAA